MPTYIHKLHHGILVYYINNDSSTWLAHQIIGLYLIISPRISSEGAVHEHSHGSQAKWKIFSGQYL